jgi:hypothetical protein
LAAKKTHTEAAEVMGPDGEIFGESLRTCFGEYEESL